MKFQKLFVLLAFVATAACSNSGSNNKGPQDPPIRNAKPGQGIKLVIGDSLASGQGAEEFVTTPTGCLETAFGKSVYNLAQPGTTSSEILKKSEVAQKYLPKLIFVSAGGNDAIIDATNAGQFPPAKTMSEMDALFERLLSTGALVVYLGLAPPMKGGERLPQISALARSKGVIVVDGMAGFWGSKDLMSDDFHPSNKGYAIMCDRIVSALKGNFP